VTFAQPRPHDRVFTELGPQAGQRAGCRAEVTTCASPKQRQLLAGGRNLLHAHFDLAYSGR